MSERVAGLVGNIQQAVAAARVARRALDAGSLERRVIGVLRFSSPEVERYLRGHGVETVSADLLEPGALARLPDAPNVVFMAGRKFGSAGAESLTWAMNAYLPGLVAERYRGSRLGRVCRPTTRRAVNDLQPDFAVVRETSAYRYLSVAPLEDLSAVLSPWYCKLADFLEAGGVHVRVVEAPGNVSEFIPLWVESGFGGLCFAEVSAGLDVRAFRAPYGKDLAVIGNLDEGALGPRRDVADELLAKGSLVSGGGCIPTPDRPVSSEVAFEDYEFYLASPRRIS